MENKNFILAIVLSLGFLFAWSFITQRYVNKQPAPSAAVDKTPSSASTSSASLSAPSPVTGSAGATASTREVALRDGGNEIVLVPAGGGIRHWRLASKGQFFDLVVHPQVDPLPFSTFPSVLFSIKAEGRRAIMEGQLPNGLLLQKTLTLNPDGYLHSVELRFRNPTKQSISTDWTWGWGPGLGTVSSEEKENARMTRAISLKKIATKKLEENKPVEIGRWAGIDNRYYLVAFIPTAASQAEAAVIGKKETTRLELREKITVSAGGESTLSYKLYAGPKGYTHLRQYKEGLEEAVDFGFFSALGKIVLRSLYFFQKITGNYGWAIVLLTVVLQILLLPLSLKSFRAMQAMKKLQPQIAQVQKLYKNDPKRLNLEMMNLYKKSGTNPFGGCLPMILQLPIFWALFTAIRNAYELRGSPFIFWIHDLSVADPYRVLPILMGISMFFQQRASGAVSDPTQRQMMYMMPIIFTVMFMGFPSGLVVYWLMQNLLTLFFQWIFRRMHKNDDAPPSSPDLVLVK